jgi:putative membrane protein
MLEGHDGEGCQVFGHGYGYGMYGMGAAMWTGWILILIVIAVLVVLLVRGTSAGSPGSPGRESRAREILEERYARGEISTDEYRERSVELDHR